MVGSELKYIKLERYYNQIKFKSIPMGSVIADQFIFSRTHGNKAFRKTLLCFCVALVRLVFNIFSTHLRDIKFNKILATRLANKPHLNNIMNPVIDHFEDKISVLTNPTIEFKSNIHKLYTKESRKAFPKDFFQILSIFLKSIIFSKSKLKKLNLSFSESLFYSCKILEQCNPISYFDAIFRICNSKPDIILTEFDRNTISAPLILVGKKYSVTTVTFVHGIIGKYGYAPILADFVFCWGNEQKKTLISQKVPTEKIVITGTTIIDENCRINNDIPNSTDKNYKICLGINPVRPELIKYTIDIVIKAVIGLSDIELIIKLHPSQARHKFIEYEALGKNIRVVASHEINNQELFGKINLLIIENSGLGIEALISEVPVAVINTGDENIDFGKVLINKAHCPTFKSSEELKNLISDLRDNPGRIEQMKSYGKQFAREYYFATGIVAAEIITNKITELYQTNL
jgi:glycosyltransferase involved in cell wall biosynthesis